MHNATRPLLVAAAITALVAGCGGGGGSGASALGSAVALGDPAARSAAEGFWSGRTTEDGWAELIILEDGSTWGVFADAVRVIGGAHGTSAIAQGRFSATLAEASFLDETTTERTYSGGATPRVQITAQAADGRNLALLYDTAYQQPASTQALAGRYALDENTVLAISADGAFNWVASADCVLTGNATPRASGRNVFNLALTYLGNDCLHGDGTRISGVAYLDAQSSPARLVSLALKQDQGIGFISRAFRMVDPNAPAPAPAPAAPVPAPAPAQAPAPSPAPSPAPAPPRDTESLRISAGHYPPPGTCRIWVLGVPPGRQSPAGNCAELEVRVGPGAVLIRG